MRQMQTGEMRRILSRRAEKVELFLAANINRGAPSALREAMAYSLEAGGKRIRPALCMATASLCGLSEDLALPFAAAIEMIHTYSLIHDDLPAMDNDDFRRGKPSSHKKFGEAAAILAGDALLTDAFALMLTTPLPPAAVLAAAADFAAAAGSGGMAGGQHLDMLYTGRDNVSLDAIAHMQALKTGAILRSACACGAILAQAPADLLAAVNQYGTALGKAFQIADDLLDITGNEKLLGKPVGSDNASGKNTYPSRIGISESWRIAREEAEKARAALPDLPEADFLATLAGYVIERSN